MMQPSTHTWEASSLANFHPAFHSQVQAGYDQAAPHYQAENYLSQQQAIAKRTPATDLDTDELKARAVIYAAKCKALAPEPYHLPQRAIDYVASMGMTLPVVPKNVRRVDGVTDDKAKREGIRARITSEKWWARRLRIQQGQRQELQAIRLGIVNAQRQAYLSDYGLKNVLARQEMSREWLGCMDLVDEETGEVLPLKIAADASVSNPVNRRNEMMLRIADGERYFNEHGHVALFLTLTTPSRFHKFTRAGTHTRKDRMGVPHSIGGRVVPNPNYQEIIQWKTGSGKNAKTAYRENTPRLAHEWQSISWARFRSAINRRDIEVHFMRVTEPHHDGVTHWHAIVFVKPADRKEFTRLLWRYWLREDADEPGARKHRVQIVKINPFRGRAAGYIAKYISKNIQDIGIASETDYETGLDSVDAATRVQAWRSRWVVRAFQFSHSFGKVSLWRELRRLREQQDGVLLEAVRSAADSGDYFQFLQLTNGNPGAFAFMEEDNTDPNGYGEITRRVVGLLHQGGQTITRTHQWALVQRPENDATDQPAGNPALLVPVFGSGAWSPVNNYTQGAGQEVQP